MNKLLKKILVSFFSLILVLTLAVLISGVSKYNKSSANDMPYTESYEQISNDGIDSVPQSYSSVSKAEEQTTFTVTFRTNTETEIPSQIVEYGGKVTKPEQPVREGYKFISWKYDGKAWNFDTDVVTKDITLFVSWLEIEYTVTFDSDGGTPVDSQVIKYDNLIVEPTSPTKTGYHLAGWKYGKVTWDFTIYTVKGDMKLVAVWEKDLFNITFDSNGGSLVETQQVAYQECVIAPTSPTKTGYTFVKWLYNGEEWDFDTIITEEKTLVAEWKINEYKVTFNSNGGSDVQSQTVIFETTAEEPVAPVRKGYHLVEWRKGNVTWNFETDIVTSDITLIAFWEKNTYTVQFDTLGGTKIANQSVKYQGKVEQPERPVLDEYEFLCWTYNGKYWNFDTDVVEDNITIVAVYRDLKITIEFDSLGGSNVMSQRLWSGEKLIKPENPTKTGYTFVCWNNGDKEWDFDVDTIDASIKLTAVWVEKYFIVEFNSNGGTRVVNKLVQDGNKMAEPETPIKNGFVFKGWYYNSMKWDFSKDVVERDMKLVAKWEEPTPEPVEDNSNKTLLIVILVLVGIAVIVIIVVVVKICCKHTSEDVSKLEKKDEETSEESNQAKASETKDDENTETTEYLEDAEK